MFQIGLIGHFNYLKYSLPAAPLTLVAPVLAGAMEKVVPAVVVLLDGGRSSLLEELSLWGSSSSITDVWLPFASSSSSSSSSSLSCFLVFESFLLDGSLFALGFFVVVFFWCDGSSWLPSEISLSLLSFPSLAGSQEKPVWAIYDFMG